MATMQTLVRQITTVLNVPSLRKAWAPRKKLRSPAEETVIPGGKTEPLGGSSEASVAAKSPIYRDLGLFLLRPCRRSRSLGRVKETVIPGGETAILDGRSVIPGGINCDPRRKIGPFTAIPDGINRDPRRKPLSNNSCKSAIFSSSSKAPLLFVILYSVLLTNKGKLDQIRIRRYSVSTEFGTARGRGVLDGR